MLVKTIIFDLKNDSHQIIKTEIKDILGLAWSKDNTVLAVAGSLGKENLCLIDTTTFNVLNFLQGHKGGVAKIAFLKNFI